MSAAVDKAWADYAHAVTQWSRRADPVQRWIDSNTIAPMPRVLVGAIINTSDLVCIYPSPFRLRTNSDAICAVTMFYFTSSLSSEFRESQDVCDALYRLEALGLRPSMYDSILGNPPQIHGVCIENIRELL